MPEKILQISIRIADQPRINLQVPQSQEAIVRKAEASINELWRVWPKSEKFAGKSPSEVLAAIAFQFARLYYRNEESVNRIDEVLSSLEGSLDNLLMDDILPQDATSAK